MAEEPLVLPYTRVGSLLVINRVRDRDTDNYYGTLQFWDCDLLHWAKRELACKHPHRTRDAAVVCALKALGDVAIAANRPIVDG